MFMTRMLGHALPYLRSWWFAIVSRLGSFQQMNSDGWKKKKENKTKNRVRKEVIIVPVVVVVVVVVIVVIVVVAAAVKNLQNVP